jgi:hypothetical protein
MIPLIIETEREFGKSEREIYKIVDAVLDRINELRRQLKKED